MSEKEKKDNVKKLFKWEGWKKEVSWILFFIFILILAWTYYTDKKEMEKMTNSDCFRKCMVEEVVKAVHEKNPSLIIQCDYKTLSCIISGNPDADLIMGGFNITFEGE